VHSEDTSLGIASVIGTIPRCKDCVLSGYHALLLLADRVFDDADGADKNIKEAEIHKVSVRVFVEKVHDKVRNKQHMRK
jgi:hypothetical protein